MQQRTSETGEDLTPPDFRQPYVIVEGRSSSSLQIAINKKALDGYRLVQCWTVSEASEKTDGGAMSFWLLHFAAMELRSRETQK